MKISFDPAKRERTRTQRGLDFEHAAKMFAGPTLTLPDQRQDYGETRYQSLTPWRATPRP